jgi:hypothetical protein
MLKTVAIALTLVSSHPAPSIDETNNSAVSEAQSLEVKKPVSVGSSEPTNLKETNSSNDAIANKKYKPRGLITFPHAKGEQTLDSVIANKKYKPRGLITFPHAKELV